jgi:LPPG:FO 2-phospho-L-lactate transferase
VKVVALAGGVGGAKLAHGLAQVLPPDALTVAVNTGDDFEHLGLHVSPDLDTVMYTLAGLADRDRGWGLADESWNFMAALERLGGPAWFRLGDRDLATHVERTQRLHRDHSLTAVTSFLCTGLGIKHAVIPMSDDPVRTFVETDDGPLEFQHYFVREQCRPRVRALDYRGAQRACPSALLLAALREAAGVVVCPSNPYLSIAPILSIPGLKEALRDARPVVAVSPIVGGAALKGPAAKIMRELGVEPSALEVARYYSRNYGGVIDTLVIDRADAALAPAIEALGMRALVTETVMRTDADRARLARECLAVMRK